MKKTLFAGLLGAALLFAAQAMPALAGCSDSSSCGWHDKSSKKQGTFKKNKSKSIASQHRKATYRATWARKHVAARRHKVRAAAIPAQAGHVAGLIRAMAPQQGVPAWFALRIAKVESNFNPRLRGRAGEYGVFQLKCATARGIGFRGNCASLLDPRTNIHYGIKHLALAMKSSRGNLRLAASKHNGGLGRKTMIYGYIAKVF